MRLPNAENAQVTSEKLVDYLLSTEHPVGRWKAKVFHRYGFNSTNVELLRNGLLSIARIEDVQDTIRSPHGEKYIIDGSLRSPGGSILHVRTIWIVQPDKGVPRFVTAYPL